jgi:hypothetical protein
MRLRAVLLIAVAAIVVAFLALRGGDPPPALLPSADNLPAGDPLAWNAERSGDDATAASEGLAHVLYEKSPGGMVASAQRAESWRPVIEQVAKQSGTDPDTLESIVLLESAGRPEAQASSSLEGAVGLTQILAETGRSLLGMRVDVAASERLTRRLVRADRAGRAKRARRLRAARRRVDERFDPRKAIAGTARYLQIARARLGRDDLAIASYHMGIGNLRQALSLYGAPNGVPYARLYFDSTPLRHQAAQHFLARLGDDSSTYLWRVGAAREALRLLRDDRDELRKREDLHTGADSAELVLHPPGDTKTFGDLGALRDGRDGGELVELPAAYLTRHAIVAPSGALLRREALATLAYLGTQTRRIGGSRRPLRVVRALQPGDDMQATGYSFDIARTYASRRQALAFQFVLDRLTALNLIAWSRTPSAIHVTVSSDAQRLEEPMGVHPEG